MDSTLIVVALISTCGFIVGIQMMQMNWTKRQEIKYKYQLKRQKASLKKSGAYTKRRGIPSKYCNELSSSS